MVIDNETLEPCHQLSKEGQERYHQMLEEEADRILFKANHPISYYISLIKDFICLLCSNETE